MNIDTINNLLLLLPVIAVSMLIGCKFCINVDKTEYCIRPTKVIMWEYGVRKSNADMYIMSIILMVTCFVAISLINK